MQISFYYDKVASVINMTKQLKGSLSILLATVIWGSTFVAQSVGVEKIGPFTFLALRCYLAVAVLLPVVFLKSRQNFSSNIKEKRLWLAAIPCGIALFVATGLQQLGLMYTTAGKSGFITAMYLLLVPIFGLFLKKRLRLILIPSILLASAGLYLLSGAKMNDLNLGDILTFGCAIAFAVQILIVDQMAQKVDSIRLNMVQSLVCALISTIFMIFEKPNGHDILSCWLPLGYAGILSMGVAYTLQIVGQKALEPTTASLLMSFESIFAALSGWLVLNEVFTLPEGIGCALVFTGILLSQIPIRKKAPV